MTTDEPSGQQMREGAAFRGRAFRASRGTITAGALTVLLVAMLLVHALLYETFTVPSASMEPTYRAGDRILVDKRDDVRRGDAVVFSGEGSMYQPGERNTLLRGLDALVGWFGFRPAEQDYLKRVIGIGGDRVVAGHDGTLRVNGSLISEPYLPNGLGHASAQPFSIVVPRGSVFVMGDNRDHSDDSRNHFGDPGGGYVPTDRIIGTVAGIYWPR